MTPPTTMAMMDCYTEAFDLLDGTLPEHGLRSQAMERFRALGFPTPRDERWRYTNVKSIANAHFRMASDSRGGVTIDDIADHLLHHSNAIRVVFVNGRFEERLSDCSGLQPGIRVGSLAAAIRSNWSSIEPYLGRFGEWRDEVFSALNTALFTDGLHVHIHRHVVVERPIHVLYLTVPGFGDPIMTVPRTLIVAEACSEVTVIESYASSTDALYFTCAATEIIADEQSVIDHYRVVRESDSAQHISELQIEQAANTNISSHSFSMNGKLVCSNLDASLDGEGCDCHFNGLYMTRGTQHADSHLRINHNKPRCNSREFYKGILDDQSTAVFRGRIYVEQDAQKTDAKQTNRNLLLSPDARVTTKPQLEIFADDVKCTHGATIGQLEGSELFYLQARGIGAEAAKSLLTYAFANEAIDDVKVSELREQLQSLVLDRLPHGHTLVGGL